MEIKKYVLLDDKTIQECNEDKMHITSDNYLAMNSGMVIGKVLKMSDDILDLVEVGDLVETVDNRIIKVEEIEIHEEGSYPNEKILFTDLDETYYGSEVKTIYKNQPNGDYKRYEVKEK